MKATIMLAKSLVLSAAIASLGACGRSKTEMAGASTDPHVWLDRGSIPMTFGLREKRDALNVAAFTDDSVFVNKGLVSLVGSFAPQLPGVCARHIVFKDAVTLVMTKTDGQWKLLLKFATDTIDRPLRAIMHDGYVVGFMTPPLATGDGKPSGDLQQYDYYVMLKDRYGADLNGKPTPKTYRVEAFAASSWGANASHVCSNACDCERPDVDANYSTTLIAAISGPHVGETHSGEGGERK